MLEFPKTSHGGRVLTHQPRRCAEPAAVPIFLRPRLHHGYQMRDGDSSGLPRSRPCHVWTKQNPQAVLDSNQNGSARLTSVRRELGSYCVAANPDASSLAYVARSRVALGVKLSFKLLGFPNVRNYDGS